MRLRRASSSSRGCRSTTRSKTGWGKSLPITAPAPPRGAPLRPAAAARPPARAPPPPPRGPPPPTPRRPEPVGAAFAPQAARLDERLHELLDEERVALSAPADQLRQPVEGRIAA